MDNAITGTPNSLSGNYTSSIKVDSPVITSTTQSSSFASPISNNDVWTTWNIITVILIVAVLAVLGLNIFSYLAKGTDVLGNYVTSLTSKVPDTATDIIQTSVIGTELGADVAAGTVKDMGDLLSRELDIKRKDLWETRDNGIRKSIENRDMAGINNFPEHEPSSKTYKESSEDNNIQEKHKPGYCYIGTDRGFRSCIKVNSRDQCESDKIFPTMDICVNPSLRS